MSERTREFPCSRMDLPRVERWFARQAGEGKMISRLNMGLGNGVFEDILGQECHFCIRPYKAKLDKTVLSSAGFSQFRQRFEDLVAVERRSAPREIEHREERAEYG